jgi:hypothetical protein
VHRKVSRNDREDDHGEKDEEGEKGKEGKESSQGQTGCQESSSQEVGQDDRQESCQEDGRKAHHCEEGRKGPGPEGQDDQDCRPGPRQGQGPAQEAGSREAAGCGCPCAEARRAACAEAAHGRATEATRRCSGSEAGHALRAGRGCTETDDAAATEAGSDRRTARHAETGRSVSHAQPGFPGCSPGIPCTAQTGFATAVVAGAERPYAAPRAWIRWHKRFLIALSSSGQCGGRAALLALSCWQFVSAGGGVRRFAAIAAG